MADGASGTLLHIRAGAADVTLLPTHLERLGGALMADGAPARVTVAALSGTSSTAAGDHLATEPLRIPAGDEVLITGTGDVARFTQAVQGAVPADGGKLVVPHRSEPRDVLVAQQNAFGASIPGVIEARLLGKPGEQMPGGQTYVAAEAAPAAPAAVAPAPAAAPAAPFAAPAPAPAAPAAPGRLTVPSDALRALLEGGSTAARVAPLPVPSRDVVLYDSPAGQQAARAFENARGRALGNVADLYGQGEPPAAVWMYLQDIARRHAGGEDAPRADLAPLLHAQGAYDPRDSELLTSAQLDDDAAVLAEVQAQLARPDRERSNRPLVIYLQECLAKKEDEDLARRTNDDAALACSPAAAALPYVADGHAGGRAALLLACMSFRDRTLAPAALCLARAVPLEAVPADPFPFLAHSHALATAALSDACYDRVAEVRAALEQGAAALRGDRGAGAGAARCGAASPWPVLAAARAAASATAEITLACMRTRACDAQPAADAEFLGADQATALDDIDARFGTVLGDVYRSLIARGYPTHALRAVAAQIYSIISTTAQRYVELPPATTEPLRVGLHAQGALQLAAAARTPFLRELALADAARPWTHVNEGGGDWPAFCIDNAPRVEVATGRELGQARAMVETTGSAVVIAVQAATERAAPGRGASGTADATALARALDAAVADLMGATLTLTVVLAQSSAEDNQYVVRLQEAYRRRTDQTYGFAGAAPAYTSLFDAKIGPATGAAGPAGAAGAAGAATLPLANVVSGVRAERPRTLFG